MIFAEIKNVIGVKVSYPLRADHGAKRRTLTIYTENGRELAIDVVTPPDTGELPVDVETPTASR